MDHPTPAAKTKAEKHFGYTHDQLLLAVQDVLPSFHLSWFSAMPLQLRVRTTNAALTSTPEPGRISVWVQGKSVRAHADMRAHRYNSMDSTDGHLSDRVRNVIADVVNEAVRNEPACALAFGTNLWTAPMITVDALKGLRTATPLAAERQRLALREATASIDAADLLAETIAKLTGSAPKGS